jgi:putative peptidoglycan lipid II flippase
MPLVCMTAIKAGMLQVHGRFGASMSGPLVLNAFIIVIGGYCWLTGQKGGATVAYVLAGATVLSGLTQLVYFARLLRPSFRFVMPGPGGAQWRSARPRARVMLRRFVPVMLGLGTLQVNTFVDTLIAMWPIWIGPTLLGRTYPLDASSNAIMNFTQRLYQFPLGVFGVAVATAAFPMLSRHANDPEKFLHTVQRGVRLSLFIGLPASVGLALVREDATAVLFGFGKTGFSPDGLVRSAAVLLGFATGIWAYSLNHFWARVFYSKGDTRTPMLVSVAMVLLNVTLNFTLIWRLKEAGLAWSTSLCAIIQCLVLVVLARRYTDDARRQGARTVFDVATTRGVAKIAFATIIMGLGVWLIHPMLGPRTSWTQHAVGLCVSIGVGALLFGAACFLMRIHEARWLMHREPPAPVPAMQPDTD